MVSAEEIVRQHPFDPDGVEWVVPPQPGDITVVEYDPTWPATYALLANRVRAALGDDVLALDHVGSTSVPGLAAKPIIDLDLTVADSTDESRYRPQLEAAGFTLVLRERAWHQHRMHLADEPRAHLHVWSPDCPEAVRHLLLRDWLREHPEDREAYAAAKKTAADRLRQDGGPAIDYNELKAPTIREILYRVFRAHGLLPAFRGDLGAP
ncbi:GrpB family protein [Cellulomonas fengjieae]|uniref:GrpB family protein n=1 Tax=Cellulomonas fengjieae TaxID=2819978 RepID=A0ABS3SC96_9CELL|nr:GrpB family protein [Cellulomonas fengjieae]MBO3083366.1 GrpB family protein [Cellulomonas fengjieae]QVI65292.1 GrpB family protein [Cellulomonas fengjieae]